MKNLPNLYPFIFARLTDNCIKDIKLFHGLGDTEVKDWMVVIAQPDFIIYKSAWMRCEVQGDYSLIPDVDISIEKDHFFPTFDEAKKFVGEWWVKQMAALETD